MKKLKILYVEDESETRSQLEDLLKKAGGKRLASDEFEDVVIDVAGNQADAECAANQEHYDIVLLDLEYPDVAGGTIDRDGPNRFRGLLWLPGLRRLQLNAAIVILTKYPAAENICMALRAGGANDFIAKTEPFSQKAARIQTAWTNVAELRRAERGREEFWDMLRSEAARVYAEDVAILLTGVKSGLFQIARGIESQDDSLIREAPQQIRNEFATLWKNYQKLTADLPRANEKPENVDVLEDLIRQTVDVYAASIKIPTPSIPPLRLTTYKSDVKVVLHELLRNAIEFGTGPIEIELEHFDGGVNIQLMNLPGFSQIALDHLFEPGFTTKQDDPRHSGRGLWLTRRLLHPTVGDVIAGNDKQGKAHITVMVNDLRAE